MSRRDPRGHFVICLENGEIVLEHTGPSGESRDNFSPVTKTRI